MGQQSQGVLCPEAPGKASSLFSSSHLCSPFPNHMPPLPGPGRRSSSLSPGLPSKAHLKSTDQYPLAPCGCHRDVQAQREHCPRLPKGWWPGLD